MKFLILLILLNFLAISFAAQCKIKEFEEKGSCMKPGDGCLELE